MQVTLELDDSTSDRWPHIVVREALKAVAEHSEPPAQVTSINHDNVFEMMEFLHSVPEAIPQTVEAPADSSDIASFVKKKKKSKPINPEEVIPADALEKTKMFEREAEEKSKAILKPKIGSSGFEYAEILDVRHNSSEYAKMKNNLARTVSFL